MRKLICFFSVLIFLLINPGCSSDSDTTQGNVNGVGNDENEGSQEERIALAPLDYVAWVEDANNGLKVEKEIEAFTYTLQYKPLDLVALIDLKKELVSAGELKNKKEEYKELQYFTFKITTDSQTELLKKNVKNENDYYGRIQYFSFDMQRDLKLIDGKDTLDCVLFHFERVFGLAPYATFNLGFQATENKGDKTLFYDEKVFGAGKLYLKIQSKNIKRIPSVITQ